MDGLWSLPALGAESEAGCVLGNGSLNLVRCSFGELGVDLDGDLERRVGIGRKQVDDLFGDLDHARNRSNWT